MGQTSQEVTRAGAGFLALWRIVEKKTNPGGGPLRLTPEEQHVPRGQQYAVGVVLRFLALVLEKGASFCGAAGALALLPPPTSPAENTPVESTGRLWMMRVGLAALMSPKV